VVQARVWVQRLLISSIRTVSIVNQ